MITLSLIILNLLVFLLSFQAIKDANQSHQQHKQIVKHCREQENRIL